MQNENDFINRNNISVPFEKLLKQFHKLYIRCLAFKIDNVPRVAKVKLTKILDENRNPKVFEAVVTADKYGPVIFKNLLQSYFGRFNYDSFANLVARGEVSGSPAHGLFGIILTIRHLLELGVTPFDNSAGCINGLNP